MVTITSIGTHKCVWCLEKGEGVEAKFNDGLHGFFCKKHFWQALQARTENQPVSSPGVHKPDSGK